MCDFFQLNFVRPSYKAIKRANKKGVQFVHGEHVVIFKCVVKIYKEVKQVHNIGGPIPVILVEDELKSSIEFHRILEVIIQLDSVVQKKIIVV
jgi:hypothetical protein